MTIIISQQAYWETWDENLHHAYKIDPGDDLDTVYRCPQQFGGGDLRVIELRKGLQLVISNYHFSDRLILQSLEREHPLEYNFYLSGGHTDKYSTIGAGQYSLCGSGIAPKEHCEWSAAQPIIEINVHMQPEIFRSFVGDQSEQLAPELQHLVKSDRHYHKNSGTTTPAMQVILQQILQCPYYGITKRMYLEAKVLELMALLVEKDVEARTGEIQTYQLKSDDLERLHHAKEILLRNFDNPPSLVDLSRQVGLNECTFKQAFRQVFGTTAFHYLHHYRLEKAHQLLQTGEMNVTEVARIVGFASRSYFASAFRKKFGINPKQYLINRKNSL
ncbi:helix-turn-helix transcriptional regulator [Fortiea contorta]|uniref:helix-turn-helix transcriptional regulator n=1 Tax=Fortiea contorta TaxID=1892405 RepID=UPI00034CA77F|nr:AraC family transcriptional regulator [Fortiea contorta]